MTSHPTSSSLDRLAASVLRVSSMSELSDLELLGRFAADRDESAFTILVRRHGRLVSGVCRRVLHDSHHAEDVLQATFLLLAQNAGKLVRRGVVVPGWLYLAARRIALRARRADDRRRLREQATASPQPKAGPDSVLIWEEVKRAVDDEIAGLPSKYREAVVLCYFAGMTQDQIAAQLQVPRTTAQFRLEKGRSLLEQRLVRRGLALSAVMTAILAIPTDAPAAVALARAAVAWVSGQAPGGLITVGAQALVRGASAGIGARGWALVVSGLLLAAAGGMGWLFTPQPVPVESPVAAEVPLPSAPVPRPVDPNRERLVVTGRVSAPGGEIVPHADVAVLAADPTTAWQPLAHDRELARGQAGADGRFRIELPQMASSGSIKLLARANNHALGTAIRGSTPPQADLTVTLPATGAPFRMRLIDPDGRPAVGVRVAATQIGVVRAEVASQALPPFWPRAAISGADGRAELAGVQAQNGLTVTVLDDRFEPISLALFGGTDGEQEVRLKPARTCEVAVAAVGSGRPIAGVRLVLVPLVAGTDEPIAGLATIGESGADGVCRMTPVAAGRYRLTALPPPGSPHLPTRVTHDWPADGRVKHVERLAIPPAVVVRGRVTGLDGRPVRGAIVHAIPAGEREPTSTVMTGADAAVRTGADGAFALAVPPGEVAVLVHGPGEDYVSKAVESAGVSVVQRYAHATAKLRLTAGEVPAVQNFQLAVGERVPVRVELADGSPSAQAVLVCRSKSLGAMPDMLKRHLVTDGKVELHGCDPDRDYPVIVWDLQKRQGATAIVPGRPTDTPMTIRLAPFGAAGVRGVDADGQPAGFTFTRLTFNLPPDVPRGSKDDPFAGEPSIDNEFDARLFDLRPFAPRVPGDRPGEVPLTGLVPGATYRVALQVQNGWRRSEGFRVQSGESRRLPDVVVRP